MFSTRDNNKGQRADAWSARIGGWAILLIAVGFCPAAFVPAHASTSDLRLLQADARGLLIELDLPGYRFDPATRRVTVADYGSGSAYGYPDTPVRGALIALPATGAVRVTTEPGDFETVVPGSGPFTPGAIVARGFTGFLRDQRVMQLLFFPVQYDAATGEVRVYRTITARIDFEDLLAPADPARPTGVGDAGPPSAYRDLMRGVLLNHGAAVP